MTGTLYGTIDTMKSILDIDNTTYDTELIECLDEASRHGELLVSPYMSTITATFTDGSTWVFNSFPLDTWPTQFASAIALYACENFARRQLSKRVNDKHYAAEADMIMIAMIKVYWKKGKIVVSYAESDENAWD